MIHTPNYDCLRAGDEVPLTVALIGCGKSKSLGHGPLPARQLYNGSLFRLALRHAEQTADAVFVLSALHGILNPSEVIEPYDLTFSKMFIHEHDEWGQKVVSDLFMQFPLTPLRIVFYAGQQYIQPVVKWSHSQAGYWIWEDPLKGLDLFERLKWFREHQTDTAI